MRSPSHRWSSTQWPVLGALAAAALVLGWIGFADHLQATGDPGILAAFYRSIQLFVLEFNAPEPTAVSTTLQIARFLAPAVAGYALVLAAVALFREQIDHWLLRRRRNHVVVCGLGSRGAALAAALADSGWTVTGVDLDPPAGHRMPAVEGDASDPGVLRDAGVPRAAHVVALCGTDAANAAVALAVADACGDRRPVTHVHLADPRLCAVLRSEAVAAGADLEFFTVFEESARVLLDRIVPSAGRPRIAVVGLGRFGRAVLLEAARRHPGLHADVFDRRASEILEDLRARLPGFAEAVDVVGHDEDTSAASFGEEQFPASGEMTDLDAVFVCLGDESASLAAALGIHRRIRRLPVPPGGAPVEIVARVSGGRTLADLVAPATPGESAHLTTFDPLRACLDESLLTGATGEAIAAALHREYLRSQLAAGRPMGSAPAMRPWHEVDEEVKEANRAAASGVGPRLRAVGADIVPRSSWDPEPIRFTPAEEELLAILEHRRWCRWKLDHGFRPPSPGRDGDDVNPHLVPWNDLDETARHWVRDSVRALPAVLLDAGLEVVRVDRGIARSLHDEYRRMRTEAGDTPADNPSLVPWEQLTPALQASNRDQAAHIRVKLMALGLDAVPGEPDPEFAFTDVQVEGLSRMEHDRWVAHRRFEGWRPGPVKDAEAGVSPSMVGWDELSEEMREVDREFVRAIPRLLATAGLRIVPDPGP